MKKARTGRLPNSQQIVAETFAQLGLMQGKAQPDQVRADFNHNLRLAFDRTLKVLESYEAPIYGKIALGNFVKQRENDVKRAERQLKSKSLGQIVSNLLEKWYPSLLQIFLSVSQSRKTRGGKDFELELSGLFDLAEIPFEMQRSKDRVDFFLPSEAVFRTDRNKALIVSAKRTLRERWREVAAELYEIRSPNVYLATADDDISDEKVKGLTDHNVYLLLWDEIKKQKFSTHPKVIGFSEFVNDRLPAFEALWKREIKSST